MKYICEVCGYVYDPAEGDPDSGIEPGTAFEDISQEQLLRIFPMIGYAPSVAWAKTNSSLSNTHIA